MTPQLAENVASGRSRMDVSTLLKRVRSCRLIGEPGYSMRISIDEEEIPALRRALGDNFSVEVDYALDSFSRRRVVRKPRKFG